MSDKYAESRANFLTQKGWTWYFTPEKPKPKSTPRKLFADDEFMLMRPTLRVER